MKYVCPALETVLTNCYQSPIRLFVSGGGEILSKEGTTLGDPLGMAMFAHAIVLIILKLMEVCQMVYQVSQCHGSSILRTTKTVVGCTVNLWAPLWLLSKCNQNHTCCERRARTDSQFTIFGHWYQNHHPWQEAPRCSYRFKCLCRRVCTTESC